MYGVKRIYNMLNIRRRYLKVLENTNKIFLQEKVYNDHIFFLRL